MQHITVLWDDRTKNTYSYQVYSSKLSEKYQSTKKMSYFSAMCLLIVSVFSSKSLRVL